MMYWKGNTLQSRLTQLKQVLFYPFPHSHFFLLPAQNVAKKAGAAAATMTPRGSREGSHHMVLRMAWQREKKSSSLRLGLIACFWTP